LSAPMKPSGETARIQRASKPYFIVWLPFVQVRLLLNWKVRDCEAPSARSRFRAEILPVEKLMSGSPLKGKSGPIPGKPSAFVNARPSNGKEDPLSLSVNPKRASFNRCGVIV